MSNTVLAANEHAKLYQNNNTRDVYLYIYSVSAYMG